jgi:polyhydroxyalkanoate synthesis regulator phasin
MAKKDKKKSKKANKQADPVGAVRTAVERTFQATADSAQSTRTRAQDLVDEVAGAAGRVREMIEDINVLEDLKRLRTEVETLRSRVAALEDKPAPARKPASTSRASGTRARSTTTRKTAASSTAKAAGTARSTAAKRTAAKRSTATKSSRSTAAKSRSTASKPRSTAKKPASS